MTKSGRHVMEILEAFDLTHCAYAAAKLTGVDPKTVARYVAVRDAGGNPFEPVPRARIIDPYLEKIEELVERSHGKVRADVVHDNHLVPMASVVTSARRAVRSPRPRRPMTRSPPHLPTVGARPGMWHSTTGPRVPKCADGRRVCSVPGWPGAGSGWWFPPGTAPFPTTLACVDAMLRRFGAAPTYLLTDNERVVTSDRVAGLAVRHPVMVAAARHYGLVIETCVPYDPRPRVGRSPVSRSPRRTSCLPKPTCWTTTAASAPS